MRGSTPRIPGTDPALDSHILRLRDKYPRLDEHPRLLERLGQAFVERRAFILHQNSRFTAPGAGAAGQVAGGEGLAPEQLTSLAATTFEERSVNLEAHEDCAAQSVRSGATSFVTVVSEGDDGELRVPELSRLTFHGVRLGHDEAFECPFCRNFVSVASARNWSYVFRICIPTTTVPSLSRPFLPALARARVSVLTLRV